MKSSSVEPEAYRAYPKILNKVDKFFKGLITHIPELILMRCLFRGNRPRVLIVAYLKFYSDYTKNYCTYFIFHMIDVSKVVKLVSFLKNFEWGRLYGLLIG